MRVTPAKEVMHLHAAQVIRQYLENPASLKNQLSQPFESIFTTIEQTFLTGVLSSDWFTNWLNIVDIATAPQKNGLNSSSKNNNNNSPISSLRPTNNANRNCLLALNDAWNELESLLTRVGEDRYPDARELYDILGDDHVRELLVAVDDVANYRYTAYVEPGVSLISLYTEPEVEENELGVPKMLPFVKPIVIPSLPEPEAETLLPDAVAHFPVARTRKNQNESTGLVADLKTIKRVHPPPPPLPLSASSPFAKDISPGKGPKVKIDTRVADTSPNNDRNLAVTLSPSIKFSAPSEDPKPSKKSFKQLSPHTRRRILDDSSINGKELKTRRGYQSLNRPKVTRHPSRISLPDEFRDMPEPGSERRVCIRRLTAEEKLGISLTQQSPSQSPERGRHTYFQSLLSTKQADTGDEMRNKPPVICIQRILAGSLADLSGKLYPGDVLLEINGISATNLDEVNEAMKAASADSEFNLLVRTPNLRMLKSYMHQRSRAPHKVFIRCLFTYDPAKDDQRPVGEKGLFFKSGDVLELVNSQDSTWWQARRLDSSSGMASFIPAKDFEESRQASKQESERQQQQPKKTFAKRIQKLFKAADSTDLLVRADLWTYEEVVPWPPTPVSTLLLIGSNGVGRRTLKLSLCLKYPQRFAFPIPDTTDATANPALFRTRTREEMETDVRHGAYVEWGTNDSHIYGTRFTAIREVIATGRTAVLDCQCQSVHLLHQPEFNPHVVFIASPSFEVSKSMMQLGLRDNPGVTNRSDDELREVVEQSKLFSTRNQHLYTHTLVNSSIEESVEKIKRLVDRLEKNPGWVSAGWAYELNLPKTNGKGTMGRNGDGAKFIPGSSTLSGYGIRELPASSQSVINRPLCNGSSGASAESAARLARPPSICSSLQLHPKGPQHLPSGQRLYEKRGHQQRGMCQPSPIPEVISTSDSMPVKRGVSNTAAIGGGVTKDFDSRRPQPPNQHTSANSRDPRGVSSKISPKAFPNRRTTSVIKHYQHDDDDISSTSSEENI